MHFNKPMLTFRLTLKPFEFHAGEEQYTAYYIRCFVLRLQIMEFYYYSALVTYDDIYCTTNTIVKPYTSHNPMATLVYCGF